MDVVTNVFIGLFIAFCLPVWFLMAYVMAHRDDDDF